MDINPKKLDDDKLNKLTELTEKKPTQALIYGMGLVILFLVGVCWFFINRSNNIESRVTESSEKRIKKEVVERVAPYIAQITELKLENTDLKRENKGWTERYIKTADEAAEKQEKALQQQIKDFKLIEAKRAQLNKRRDNIIERTESKINTLQHVTRPSNEN